MKDRVKYAEIQIRRKSDKNAETQNNFSILKDRIGKKTKELNEGIYSERDGKIDRENDIREGEYSEIQKKIDSQRKIEREKVRQTRLHITLLNQHCNPKIP